MKLFLIFVCIAQSLFAQDIQVMTYNIKYDNVNDTVNNWNDRKRAMVDLLQNQHPEFIGMQEVLHRQLDYLNSALENYDYIGVGRDDGKKKGEYSPIFYNTEKFKVLESNTFWLSKTPTLISVGWDAAMERICTYGLFEEKATGKKVYVFNTHFDHIGTKARKNSAKLIVKQITKRNKQRLPVVLMGDFNLTPEEKPILFIKKRMEDGHAVSKNVVQGPKGTYNGFDRNAPIKRRIDYIFFKGCTISRYNHLDERLKNGKHISDHLPVLATIAIP